MEIRLADDKQIGSSGDESSGRIEPSGEDFEFALNYYGTIIEKAWEEAAFVFRFIAEGEEGTVDGRNV